MCLPRTFPHKYFTLNENNNVGRVWDTFIINKALLHSDTLILFDCLTNESIKQASLSEGQNHLFGIFDGV